MPLRYLGAVALVLTAIFGLGVVSSGSASAGEPAPLAAPSDGDALTQASAGTWVTTVYLDTAALCAGPTSFDLVTDAPDSDTTDRAPRYDGAAAPRCGAAEETAHAVTEVSLTFTPSPALSAVPQSATLVVTPPAVTLAAGDAPLELALTVRRQVTVADYLWVPYGSGVALAVLLVLLLAITGLPGPDGRRRYGWQSSFWQTPLYSKSSDWTFTSWVTNLSAVSGLAGTVLAASGTIAGLLPGVDLGRFGLAFAVAGAVAALAPLVFTLLNKSSSRAEAPVAGGEGNVVVTAAWIMLVASGLTAFGIGAEIGLVGWVLCFDLAVAPLWARACVAGAAYVLALLFIANGLSSIHGMARAGTAGTAGKRLRTSFVL